MYTLEEGVWETWDRDEVCLVVSLTLKIEELAKAFLKFAEDFGRKE
jgi:hypothetical protein